MAETLPETAPPPLDGVLVLDLSRVLAGPLAAQTLGDLGATVVKIENPDGGDDTRGWGPPYFGDEAAYYLAFNRNKRSVAVNLKSPDGVALVRRLAERADVLIENQRLGTLERMGLGVEALRALNPRLIYASVSGYGRTGPRAAEPGYDFVIQAESGLMAITGERDGGPQKVGLPISDIITGLTLGQSILAALYARGRDGLGQHIDMALLEAQMAVLGNVGQGALITGREAARYGNAHPNIVPYRVFQAADGPIVIACGNERQYRALCVGVLERPDLVSDERFVTNDRRVRNRDVLEPLLDGLLAARPAEDWLLRLRKHDIPSGRPRGVLEALTAPEAEARGVVQRGDGRPPLLRSPHRLSRTPVRESAEPPRRLGADTAVILGDLLGLSDGELERLAACGAIRIDEEVHRHGQTRAGST
ncbi:CoA transferase [Azospirillum sp. RWY-5-1]|uniref:CoA transferase n=1 Tax=Azospirillum oleiclasticum TaxID=2735135 RepID=A0ABX2TCT6_9PROT|nr:CoA transferase [Azospirillum oleiclasticum]NYZ13671.1 CoA transferase [Azospirillum oleiclasticum]NYZ20943.1 CoA transferase [Azospirillum oleiclasticum]